MASSIVVRLARPSELSPACDLLAEYRPLRRHAVQAKAYLTPLTNGTIDPAGLLVAEDALGELLGAILTLRLDGAMGIVWPPGVAAGHDHEAVEDALVSSACSQLRTHGVKVAQWLPRSGDDDGVASLERQGFACVTRLSLWRRDLTVAAGLPRTRAALEFVPFPEAEDFTSSLLASYEGSLDCPESVGHRTSAELMAAHGPPPSQSEAALWYVARHEALPIGVVLLNRGETPASGELNYIGVVTDARSRGFGRELMRFAIRRSVEVGFRNLTLSVDVRNEIALQLYRSLGFRPFEWRDVYNRVLVDGEKLF